MATIDPWPIVALGIVIALTGYALWTFLRKFGLIYSWAKKGDTMQKKQDDAFNDLNMLRGLMKTMRTKGRDVSKAGAMLRKAAEAFDKGDYNTVFAMSDDIKQALLESPESKAESLIADAATPRAPVKVQKDIMDQSAAPVNEDDETPMMVLKREKPHNYMESKFMLQKAEISVAEAEKKGRDVSSARQNLAQGRAAFEAKDYNMALSHATKVMRAFDPSMFTVLEKQEGEDAGQAKSELIEGAQAQRARPPAPVVEGKACGSCGSIGEPDDTFCHSCGEALAKKCSCGAIIKPTDKFCRKCGEKVS